MKLFTSLTLAGLLPILSSGCHAESNNKTVENHAITTNQIVNTAQPKINLNCQGFELDHDDYLLCDSWQKSNQLNKNISLKNFNKYHKINNIRDLSPSDYAFYATTELTFNEIKYNAYIYPNSRITLENPNKKVKSEMTGELENEDDIRKAIKEGEEKFGVTLGDEEIQQIVDLMLKIKALGLDPNKLVDQAADLYEKFGDDFVNHLDEAGFFQSVGDFFKEVGTAIGDFFKGLFK